MLKLKSISKYYDQTTALDSVSCHISSKEVVGLLGLNGAGKSTLLRVLVGIILPSSGSISAEGSEKELYEWQKSNIGYLPDKPPLYLEMQVEEYLLFVAKLRGVVHSVLKQRLEEVIEKLELQSVRHKAIHKISHGFKQRVGIAQAIIHKPKLVVLDEPIQGLDPLQIKQMRSIIADLGKDFCVLLSSHILSEMTQVCNRAIVLHQGRLLQELDFSVVDRESLEQRFINLLEPEKKDV